MLLIVLAIFGWSLIFTTTAYRAPRDKRLDVYFVTDLVPEETLNWFEEQIMARYDEVEDTNCLSIVYSETDYYGSMQMSTYMAAQEGDIYIMDRERFDTLKDQEGFTVLNAAIEEGTLNLRGIDTTLSTVKDAQGAPCVVAVPAAELYGLQDLQIDNRDLYICIMAYSPNQDEAIDFANWMIETMLAEKPEWLVEQEAKNTTQTQMSPSNMASY